jgi:hypothetical protein
MTTVSPNQRCPFLVIIATLPDVSIVLQEDGFANTQVVEYARLLLKGTKMHSSIVAESMPLQGSTERVYLSVGVDESVAILVGVTDKQPSWSLLSKVHSLWHSMPSGFLAAEVQGLQDQQLSVVAAPPPGAVVSAKVNQGGVEECQLRLVRLADLGEVYFTASLTRDSKLFRDRAVSLRQESARKKTVLLVGICSVLVVLLVVSVCSRKGVNLAGCL